MISIELVSIWDKDVHFVFYSERGTDQGDRSLIPPFTLSGHAVFRVYSVSFQIENDSMATPMKEASQSWIAAGGALLCFFYSCPDSQLLFWKDLLSLLLSCRQPFVLAFESMLDSSIVSWCRYGCMSLSKRHWQIRKRYCKRQKMTTT